jgi:hypothetical protein
MFRLMMQKLWINTKLKDLRKLGCFCNILEKCSMNKILWNDFVILRALMWEILNFENSTKLQKRVTKGEINSHLGQWHKPHHNGYLFPKQCMLGENILHAICSNKLKNGNNVKRGIFQGFLYKVINQL